MPSHARNEHAPTREAVIAALKKSGAESQDTRELITAWVTGREAAIDRMEGDDGSARIAAQLQLEMDKAALYRDAGLHELSLEAYREAAEAARQRHTDDVRPLYEEAMAQIEALEH